MEPSSILPTECDIVMEGGVTSGVVYPSFVARLATRFTLRSIGGTSVGAVAAVAAAAAQFCRNASRQPGSAVADDGFGTLEGLPGWLQAVDSDGKSNLFTLFQPCADLRRHFAVIEMALNRKGMWGRIGAVLWGVLRNFPLAALIGMATVAVLHIAVQKMTGAADPVHALLNEPFSLLSMVLWLPLGAFAFAAGWFVLSAIKGLSRNNGGICPGISGPGAARPALTEWLHGLVQQMAGLAPERPLTFGDLQASQPPIELAFMSTGISEFRAHRLPHDGEDLLFRVSDMERSFPPAIVQAMCAASRAVSDASEATIEVLREADAQIESGEGRDLYFLPAADALPVVFCARMSLSFPVLLQAVPLYRLRYIESDGISKGLYTLRRVWFSDGGLTSNFPIHFFDSLLPTRPTFGIALDSSLAAGAPPEARVRLPKNNMQGRTTSYVNIEREDGALSPGAFVGALLRTIRISREEALKHTPGFRDRIVQIMHTRDEGGLNLNMPPESIKAMSDSGLAAADQVISRFLNADPSENGWLNHRWVRMRTAAALMQKKSESIAYAWSADTLQPGYQALWREPEDLTVAYRLSKDQCSAGERLWQSLVAAGQFGPGEDLSQGAPKPQPTLEIAPKQT